MGVGVGAGVGVGVLQTKSSELTECVQILLGLKESPQLLWKEYLKGYAGNAATMPNHSATGH